MLLIVLISIIGLVSGNYLIINNSTTQSNYSNVITGQYFCTGYLNVWVKRTSGRYSSTSFYVGYNSNNEILTGIEPGRFFDSKISMYPTGSHYYYFNAGNGNGDTNQDKLALKMSIITIGTGSSSLGFFGDNGVPFDKNNDVPGLSIESTESNTITNGGASGVVVNYEACPCTKDIKAPLWTQTILTGDLNGSKTRVAGSIHLTGIINDKGGTSWDYRFNGHDYSLTGLNYTSAPAGMDNQVGVNSGTIKVKVTYNGQTKEINMNSADLTVLLYNQGNLTKTWNNKDRGYTIDFETGDFAREKEVKIEIEAKDNDFNEGTQCQWGNPRGGTIMTYNFNQGNHNPTIKILKIGEKDWEDGIKEINPDDPIIFEIEDDWSGIDTGTLQINVPEIKMMSGEDEIILFTGEVYDWNNFEILETGEVDSFYGSGIKYFKIKLVNHLDWPTNTGIIITGEVYDYENNRGILNKSFTTRKDCSEYYGCYNPLKINWLSGGVLTEIRYKSGVIIVTGTVAPYPYLTGENNDILMCGPISENISLTTTGGMLIKDNEDQEIDTFVGTGLYLTGENISITKSADGKLVIEFND